MNSGFLPTTRPASGAAVARTGLCLLVLLLLALLTVPARALAQARWFQVEVSIFSNENPADRAAESWRPGQPALDYPRRMQRLLRPADWRLLDPLVPQFTSVPLRRKRTAAVNPMAGIGDAVWRLADSESDFQQTNRVLERSPNHRLLFHGLWRQPVENTAWARHLHISGGERFGQHHELEGSLRIRFNANRDRVVIDTDLWLTEFSMLPLAVADWRLPAPPWNDRGSSAVPGSGNGGYRRFHPARVYPLQQSREMRSTEFHYLDHPALGLVVTVVPYVPSAPVTGQDALE